jgi:hypothetical protein
MQVSKVAVVATGALATAAAMGSTPAFAADSEGVPAVAPATVGVLDYEGKHRASDEAMRKLAEQWLTVAPEQTAPWEQEPAQVLSLGSGSALSLAPWQQCGSQGPFVAGGSAPISSPATVLGDCSNGNVDVSGDGGSDAVFSILDGTAVSALSFQQCAAGVGGAGASMPIASPATVGGSCDNGNVSASSEEMPAPIETPGYGYGSVVEVDGAEAAPAAAEVTEAATAREEQAIVPDAEQVGSAGSGSATSWMSWQQCGSPGPFVAGGSAPVSSPTTVLGDCSNGNIDITGDVSDAVFASLDRSAMSVASFQQCGSGVGGGISTPVASPATVGGSCANGNISVG